MCIGSHSCTNSNEYMVNHYKLSSKGIEERYGESDAIYLAYGASVSAGDCIITDKVATKPNASNTNMHFRTDVQFSTSAGNMGYSVTMHSILKLKAINYATKRVTIEQIFRV